jgi:Zn-dependent protease/predicted transcriptional regulator
MKWSLYLGKIAGIKIFVHWTFLILVLWIIQMHVRAGDTVEEILVALAFLVALFACIVLHELGHALTARRYHINTSSINLLPIGGVAMLEGLPEKPAQELAVAIAGPLVNVVIAGVLFAVLNITGNFPSDLEQVEFGKDTFWLNLYAVNLFLALFNLIPAFPMDGGRIFRALLSFRFPRARATRIAGNLGQVIAIAFVLFGFYVNPMLIFIGLFIFLGAQAEMSAEEIKLSLKGIRVVDVVMRQYSSLKPDEPLSHAVAMMLNSQDKAFLVKNDGDIKGTLSWKEIVSGLATYRADAIVEQVMNKKVVRISADTPLTDALEKMKETTDALFPVYRGEEFAGVINIENITEYLAVQKALEKQAEQYHM